MNAKAVFEALDLAGANASLLESQAFGIVDVLIEDRDGQHVLRFDETGDEFLYAFYAEEDEDE